MVYRQYNIEHGNEWAINLDARRILSDCAKYSLSETLSHWWTCKLIGAIPDREMKSDNTAQQLQQFDLSESTQINDNVISNNPDFINTNIVMKLKELFEAYRSQINTIDRKGGPPPKKIEPWVLVQLAIVYNELGFNPTSQREGKFHEFAEQFVELLGHEVGWIPTHLTKAIKTWKSLKDTKL